MKHVIEIFPPKKEEGIATPDETKFIFRSLDFPTKIWAKIFTPCSEKYMTPPPVLF
jgi:hypothetical protein